MRVALCGVPCVAVVIVTAASVAACRRLVASLHLYRRWGGVSDDGKINKQRHDPFGSAAGPVGKARAVFERVSRLPRATQQRILANVEDALTAYEVRKAG